MNSLLLVVSVLLFFHGLRDIMQYFGMRNVLTEFMHVIKNKKMELPSAVVSFLASIVVFWVGVQ